jgi:hypothetical protein
VPIAAAAYRDYLVAGAHQNVLTFTNVRELVGPIAAGEAFMHLRPHLQALNELPHTYIRETGIIGLELTNAVFAFENQIEYEYPDVYTTRWDRVLTLPPGSAFNY